MTKPIEDIDDPRMVKALAHPLRVRIMGLLERRTMSPKELSQALGVPLENVSYHVRALRNFGFIELERRRQVRGAIEHHYRATARPRITAQAWADMPEIVKEAMTSSNLSQLSDVVNRAASQGGFSKPESYLARQPAALDEQGFSEASAAITALLARVQEIEGESQQRIRKGATEVPAVVVTMLFDAPEPAPKRDPAERSPATDGVTAA